MENAEQKLKDLAYEVEQVLYNWESYSSCQACGNNDLLRVQLQDALKAAGPIDFSEQSPEDSHGE